jgi:hypothetical protein
MRSGACFAPATPVRLTAAPGSSLWPTPVTTDARGSRRNTARGAHWTSNPGSTLLDAVLWPTPTATVYGSSQNGCNGRGGKFERPSAGTESLFTMARRKGAPLNPGVGGATHGLSGRVDGHWPAGRGEPPRAWEPPRAKADVEQRRPRLRALGNAVVPHVATLIGFRILALERARLRAA